MEEPKGRHPQVDWGAWSPWIFWERQQGRVEELEQPTPGQEQPAWGREQPAQEPHHRQHVQEQPEERDRRWKCVCQPIWSEGVGKGGQMLGRVPLRVQKRPGPQELGVQPRWL